MSFFCCMTTKHYPTGTCHCKVSNPSKCWDWLLPSVCTCAFLQVMRSQRLFQQSLNLASLFAAQAYPDLPGWEQLVLYTHSCHSPQFLWNVNHQCHTSMIYWGCTFLLQCRCSLEVGSEAIFQVIAQMIPVTWTLCMHNKVSLQDWTRKMIWCWLHFPSENMHPFN